ncbi:MAG: hypothetical protein E7391_09105 [Ruminococcaceae bacterium]|nr:hypothetical protein [Oscillospiraceae bacterium]
MGEMYFFYNDLYPNKMGLNTRLQTIPEADDKKALGEDEKASANVKVTPTKKKNIYIGLGALLVLIVVMAMNK